MTSNRYSYLVVWQQPIPALDLSLEIRESSPLARVTVLLTMDRAISKLKAIRDRPIVAFVEAEPKAFENSDLSIELKRRAAKVFLIGEQAEEAGPTSDWGVFSIPFTGESVRQLLKTC